MYGVGSEYEVQSTPYHLTRDFESLVSYTCYCKYTSVRKQLAITLSHLGESLLELWTVIRKFLLFVQLGW